MKNSARSLILRKPEYPQQSHNGRIQNTPYRNPRHVKEDGNELYPNGKERWQIDHPRRKSLLIENAPRDQEPRVDLDAEASAHQPSFFRIAVGDNKIENRGDVVLDDDAGALDAFGHEHDPNEIGDEVADDDGVEEGKPFAGPGLLHVFFAVRVEEYVPVPVHYIEHYHGDLREKK